MGWRVLTVASDRYLSLKNNSLIVSGGSEEIAVPLEDVDTLLVENSRTTLSTRLIAALGEHQVSTVFSDNKRLPSTILLPALRHSRQLECSKAFGKLSTPVKKRLWQRVVQQKVLNQAQVAEQFGLAALASRLTNYSQQVSSGDKGNIEASAAGEYFRHIWQGTRRELSWENAAANYGYAILRSSLARYLVAFGFQPALGVHHCSEQNPFNLADDLLEPFRPFVDAIVIRCREGRTDKLSAIDKQAIVQGLSTEVALTGTRLGEHAQPLACTEILVRALRQWVITPSVPGIAGLPLPQLHES